VIFSEITYLSSLKTLFFCTEGFLASAGLIDCAILLAVG
jgi:hypothetical protein